MRRGPMNKQITVKPANTRSDMKVETKDENVSRPL